MKLSQTNVKDLLAKEKGLLSASIYIPTNPQGGAQNTTRLKNALQTIKNNPSYDERELGEVLNAIYSELIDNDDFWTYQDYGLALLFNRDGYEFFHLPFEVTEAEYLTDHYVVSPLLLIAGAYTGYYLLDVNFTKPQLFYAYRGQLEPVTVAKMPKDYESATSRGRFKNHSPGEDGNDAEDQSRYLALIAEAVTAELTDSESPILLCGTSNRTGNIRSMLTKLSVMDETLDGSFEKQNTDELYALSMPVVFKNLRAERDKAVEVLARTAPQLVVMGQAEVEEAASQGRVATLYLPAYRVTRTDDTVTNLVVDVPSDIETIEPMIAKVLNQSGTILSVEIGAYDILDVPKALCRY